MMRLRFTFLRCVIAALLLASAVAAVVEFSGAVEVDAARLRQAVGEQIQEIESRGLTPARADDAAFFLASFYRKQGYPKVVVNYELRGATVVLKISEGPRAFLRSLQFVGNIKADSAVLARYFSGVAVEEIAAARIPFHEAEVVAGGDRVRGYYVSEGWLDALVDTSASRLSPDGKAADVVVKITEGIRYEFGAVEFAGDAPYSRAELLTALGVKTEGVFSPAAFDTMEGSVRSWLRGRGHFAASVVAEADMLHARDGRIPIRITIKAGPKFRVSGIVSRGLDRVKPEFIEKRFSKITNADYAPALIDEKYRELLRTGLFRTLRVVPKESSPGRLTIELDAEEAKQKEFGFEVGYGSYDGVVVQTRVADRNFLRTGRPLSLELKSSQRGYEGELLHVDPWFRDSEWALRTRLYSQFRDEDGYSKKGAGLRVDATRRLLPRWELSAFTELALANVTAAGIEPQFLGPLDYTIMSIGLAQKVDHRDDPLNPRRGFLFLTSIELDALDGQFAFGRVTARYSRYQSIGRSLLAVGLRVGWIIPVGDAADVPIDLRYFNGGGASVRSFAERGLGPKDTAGNPLGGAFYTVANVEWDFPVSGAFGGAVFADAGNLVSDSTPGLEEMRLGVGVGVRYLLPIGPMRLDYGYNPSPRLGDAAGAVHFSFGFAF